MYIYFIPSPRRASSEGLQIWNFIRCVRHPRQLMLPIFILIPSIILGVLLGLIHRMILHSHSTSIHTPPTYLAPFHREQRKAVIAKQDRDNVKEEWTYWPIVIVIDLTLTLNRKLFFKNRFNRYWETTTRTWPNINRFLRVAARAQLAIDVIAPGLENKICEKIKSSHFRNA